MDAEGLQVASIITSSVLSGLVSSIGTVKALGVHITYLKESVTRLDAAIERAHKRIDSIEKGEKHYKDN